MNSAALFYFIPQHIDVPTDLSFSGHVLAASPAPLTWQRHTSRHRPAADVTVFACDDDRLR